MAAERGGLSLCLSIIKVAIVAKLRYQIDHLLTLRRDFLPTGRISIPLSARCMHERELVGIVDTVIAFIIMRERRNTFAHGVW